MKREEMKHRSPTSANKSHNMFARTSDYSSQNHSEEEKSKKQECLNSRLNQTKPDAFHKYKQYLWAFGDNQKVALSVQNNQDSIPMPEPAASFMKDGSILHVVSGAEHTAAVTSYGLVLTVGSNQHQKLGLAGKSILDTCTKF